MLQDPGGYELCLVSLESFDMAIARRTGLKCVGVIWLYQAWGCRHLFHVGLLTCRLLIENFGHVCHSYLEFSIFH